MDQKPIHVVASYDPDTQKVYIITAYKPGLEHFKPGFKIEKKMIDQQLSTLCPLCKGKKQPGKTTFTVDLGFGVVVIRNVPATVCSHCGADWISDITAEKLETIVEDARSKHHQVEVASLLEDVA